MARHDDLKDKNVLVTGASRGIGRAIALGFAEQGANLFLISRNHEALQSVVKEIEEIGGRAYFETADATDYNLASSIVASAVKAFGGKGLHVLINNAGLRRDNLLVRMREDDWDDVIDVNLKGAFNYCRSAFRELRKSGGSIVNVSSIVGIEGNPSQVNYAASKAGLIGLTKSLALEIGPKVRVNAVAPGYVSTEMTRDLPKDKVEEIVRKTALGRAGTEKDIADAVIYLASDDARFITGQTLIVDGGLSLGI